MCTRTPALASAARRASQQCLPTACRSNFYATAGRGYVTPGTYESRKAYLSMSEQGTRTHSTFAPYDQYEVCCVGACQHQQPE